MRQEYKTIHSKMHYDDLIEVKIPNEWDEQPLYNEILDCIEELTEDFAMSDKRVSHPNVCGCCGLEVKYKVRKTSGKITAYIFARLKAPYTYDENMKFLSCERLWEPYDQTANK